MSDRDRYISVCGVIKSFGGVRALDRVSLDIKAGEFFSLLGPSGCGKTTLLRLLAGFESPTAGEIFIDGQLMSLVPANRRPTNMVFQSYAIFPHLDVRQNIAYGLRNKRMNRKQIEAKVDWALNLIKLPAYGARRVHQLSGGERQRVALARALVCEPKVLLLDEPLGALDKKLREDMQLELRQLQRSVGITFVFVTHDQEEALTMSDRIAVMEGGRILQIDSASALYESPNSREVAAFIGNMNFIDGTLGAAGCQSDASQVVVDAGPVGRLKVRLTPGLVPPPGPVTVAVRPEKLRISDRPPDDAAVNGLMGKLVAQAYLGDRNHFYVQVVGLPRPLAIAAQNVAGENSGRDVGRSVWVVWPGDAGILLPPGPS